MKRALKLEPLAPQEWNESITHIREEMDGRPLNVHGLMAHHPELLKAWWNFRNYSVKGGELGCRKCELLVLRTSLHMAAWYEWGSHVERGLACGLTLEEIERVKEGGKDPRWETSEALLLDAIDELITTHALSAESLARLHDYYSNRQIMDVIAIHGLYIILACMINTWGLELDSRVVAELPAVVNRNQFEAENPLKP